MKRLSPAQQTSIRQVRVLAEFLSYTIQELHDLGIESTVWQGGREILVTNTVAKSRRLVKPEKWSGGERVALLKSSAESMMSACSDTIRARASQKGAARNSLRKGHRL